MNNKNKLFVFGMSANEIITKIFRYHACFFAVDKKNKSLLANDKQASIFGFSSAESLIGQNYFELIPDITEVEMDISSDNEAINSNAPRLFHQLVFGKECACIKTRLLDTSNNVIGVGGIAMYFHQMLLKDILALTDEFFHLQLVAENLKYNYISNAQQLDKLSLREKECVNCLAKNMTCKEIARALNISYRTVEKHMENIKNKLECHNRSDIMSKVFEIN